MVCKLCLIKGVKDLNKRIVMSILSQYSWGRKEIKMLKKICRKMCSQTPKTQRLMKVLVDLIIFMTCQIRISAEYWIRN